MNVLDYTDVSRICFLEETDKEQCLKKLVSHSRDCLYDETAFLKSIYEREELMSTGLGFGLAFPHSKNDYVIDFFITIGISPAGINWQSFDGKPAQLIFLIGGLVQEQEKYLRILSSLSNLVKNEHYKEKLLSAPGSSEFFDIFSELALREKQSI